MVGHTHTSEGRRSEANACVQRSFANDVQRSFAPTPAEFAQENQPGADWADAPNNATQCNQDENLYYSVHGSCAIALAPPFAYHWRR